MHRRRAPVLLLLALAVLAACEFDRVTVPRGTGRPALHLVLNVYENRRIDVLLERTLGGRVTTTDGRYDPDDPIVSTGGEPITGARVVIRNVTTNRDSGVALEGTQVVGGGRGHGLYVLVNAPCTILFCPSNGILLGRGTTYEVTVTTPAGETLTATTTIPVGVPTADTGVLVRFDARRDTYTFRWRPGEGIKRYAVQVQTPYGPFQVFSDVESLAVNGSLRNFQQSRLPRVFVPGFVQVLDAFAVDQAYFDYYRTANDPFTGSGLVSNVRGGTGVVGSLTPIRAQYLDVTAPFDDPEDGEFELIGDTTGFPPRLAIWVDGTFASGRWQDLLDPDGEIRRGMLGARRADGITLDVLSGRQLASDVAWTVRLEYRGDTLVTTSSAKGTQRWRRLPRST